jgi:trk system potassium uptake protein TrkH
VTFFPAVTPRTCGFTIIPMEATRDVTRFFAEILMFIGAAPGGAGGGIKVTTFIIFLCTVATIYKGRLDTVICKRSVPLTIVREAFVIFFFAVALIALAMATLLVTESGSPGLGFENLLFETISAVTTTGLTCGNTTSLLSPAGRVVIMICMLCGRLGAISVVLLIGGRDETISSIKYPKEELVVG